MKLTEVLFACLTLLLIAGCDLINPEEELPIYIEVSEARVQVRPGGSERSNIAIKDIWLDQGPDFAGVYEIPFTIPVYPGDFNRFLFAPGIVESGLSIARSRYLFLQSELTEINVEPLDTFRYIPEFQYLPVDTIIKFPFEEYFEDGSSDFANLLTSPSSTIIRISSVSPFQGRRCGQVEFGSNTFELLTATNIAFPLPQTGARSTFAEITYRGTVPFQVGLIVETTTREFIPKNIVFRPREDWTQIYVNLTDEVRALSGVTQFRLYIQANTDGLPGDLFLDNVRIVHDLI
ncbi:MAG: hypothetical protein AAGI38_02645 [Bacteroidota bacterium]